jgi:NADP-dependent 3-hydroxy acid dehydrogenase YdfG
VLWGRDDDRLSVDQVDLTDHPGVRAALDRVLADGPLHTVVWAAGVFDWAPADQADAGTWQRLLDVDFPANGCPVEVELQPQRTP